MRNRKNTSGSEKERILFNATEKVKKEHLNLKNNFINLDKIEKVSILQTKNSISIYDENSQVFDEFASIKSVPSCSKRRVFI